MIEYEDLPTLVNPIMIAAFEGWNDAGDAASGAVSHLCEVWQASIVTELDGEDYYDYQVNRPLVSVADGGYRQLTWPTTRIWVAHVPNHDIVLVQGPEPNMRWQQFTREILGFGVELGVQKVVTLGSLLSDSPHTRPIPISATGSHPTLIDELGLEPASYEGPTGIVGVIQEACGRFDVPAMSLWAAVPHYVAQPPCPKATLALIKRIEDLLDVSIPLGDLVDEALAWEAGVDELASDDDEVADYVKQLEDARDTADLPEASGEAIAREFERYLRRRGPQ